MCCDRSLASPDAAAIAVQQHLLRSALVVARTATHAFVAFEDEPASAPTVDLVGWFHRREPGADPARLDETAQALLSRIAVSQR